MPGWIVARRKKPYSYPHKKVSRDLTEKKARFNRDMYNFNGINRDLSEILSEWDFIIINLENLGLTRLISVKFNEN